MPFVLTEAELFSLKRSSDIFTHRLQNAKKTATSRSPQGECATLLRSITAGDKRAGDGSRASTHTSVHHCRTDVVSYCLLQLQNKEIKEEKKKNPGSQHKQMQDE